MKYHTTKDLQKAAELYGRGYSTRKVARLTGINHQTVYEWLEERGLIRSKSEALRLRAVRENGRDYAALEERAIWLYTEAKRSAKQIADILDVSKTSVNRWVQKHGVKRSRSEIQSQRNREVRDTDVRAVRAFRLRNEIGWSRRRVADHMGMSESSISRLCRRARGLFAPEGSE